MDRDHQGAALVVMQTSGHACPRPPRAMIASSSELCLQKAFVSCRDHLNNSLLVPFAPTVTDNWGLFLLLRGSGARLEVLPTLCSAW
jgi:hypothetical protein